MIRLTVVSCLMLLAISCNPNSSEENTGNDESETSLTIGLQPMEFSDTLILDSISEFIQANYRADVIILKNISIPASFKNTSKGLRYSSDSIIAHLRKNIPTATDIVVGVTGQDIFTTKRDENGEVKEPRYKYEVWGIFGLGYMPGKSCVVSTFRLKTTDSEKTIRRVKNVVIHEIGHNLGLDHCENNQCIMTDANESIATIDNGSDKLCDSCRSRINKDRFE